MIRKDKSISILIDRVLKAFDSENIKVTDYWEADLCAIGFVDKSEKYLVYVSAYEQNEDEYFVSLEYLPLTEDAIYEQGEEFKKINYGELEQIIFKHLVEKNKDGV